MSVCVFIQARMSSSRLPGKVLKTVGGIPILELIVKRLSASLCLDELVILTSFEDSDRDIEILAKRLGVNCYRGSLDNVLDRFFAAAQKFPYDHYVRITADCPLVDPVLLDQLVAAHLNSNADYSSTALELCLPDGFDIEIFSRDALHQTFQQAKAKHELEHVTYYMYNSGKFTTQAFLPDDCICRPDYRVTVDQQADLTFINQILTDAKLDPLSCGYLDVIRFLDGQPRDYFINANINRNEGLEKSLKEEME